MAVRAQQSRQYAIARFKIVAFTLIAAGDSQIKLDYASQPGSAK
jgi:hypothetical protein